MRRNPMVVALAAAACMASLAVRPIDEFDEELMREKRDAARRGIERERKGDMRPKLDRRSAHNVPANINRHTGEPHTHSREIERRLRQKARKNGGEV